jgi:cytochrome c-type biogenesis protein CcmH
MTLAFWSTAVLLLAGALLFVLPPLLRSGNRVNAGPSPLTVYREQRAQHDAELQAGTLTPQQHAQALAELQGRVIDEVGEIPAADDAPAARSAPIASILAVALLLPAGALALYGVLGKPATLTPSVATAAASTEKGNAHSTLTREQMEAMVESLAEKLEKNPNDAEGWHMLARSYVAFQRLPDALKAFERAQALAPRSADVLADHADTLAMANGRSLDGKPMELVKAALAADPKHPKSLSLAGTAAFNKGDFAGAISAWKRLLATLPPGSEGARSVAGSIAQAEEQAATQGATRTIVGAETARVSTGGDASVQGSVAIADALRGRLNPADTLFVFARAVNGPKVPVAILKLQAGALPASFKLDDALAMSPELRISGHAEVMLAARVSRSGNAVPQSGDLMGTLGPVKVGARDVKLVIDGVVP